MENVLATPFSRRTFEEKQVLVQGGRPTPELPNMTQAGQGFVRHFQTTNYERYSWLTAAAERGKLFCWECLLFAKDRFSVWTHTGFTNLTCLMLSAVLVSRAPLISLLQSVNNVCPLRCVIVVHGNTQRLLPLNIHYHKHPVSVFLFVISAAVVS